MVNKNYVLGSLSPLVAYLREHGFSGADLARYMGYHQTRVYLYSRPLSRIPHSFRQLAFQAARAMLSERAARKLPDIDAQITEGKHVDLIKGPVKHRRDPTKLSLLWAGLEQHYTKRELSRRSEVPFSVISDALNHKRPITPYYYDRLLKALKSMPPKTPTQVPYKLKKLVKSRGYTLKQLAEHTDIPYPRISNLLNSRRITPRMEARLLEAAELLFLEHDDQQALEELDGY